MIQCSVAALRKRDPEYQAEALERGTVKGEFITFRDSEYLAMRYKYGRKGGLGDLVAYAAGAFGLKQCQPCRQREATLNDLTAL